MVASKWWLYTRYCGKMTRNRRSGTDHIFHKEELVCSGRSQLLYEGRTWVAMNLQEFQKVVTGHAFPLCQSCINVVDDNYDDEIMINSDC